MNAQWTTIWSLLLSLTIDNSNGTGAVKKQVCIIGAGVTGLTAVKQVAMYPEIFNKPIVFDMRSNVGGLWNYNEDTEQNEYGMTITSGVYKYLRVNGPKELLLFPDFSEIRGENRSYVTHMDILRYLQNYTDHFKLRQYIQFNSFVVKVSALSAEISNTQWNVTVRDLKTNKYNSTICDAVMVCNGHYAKYKIVQIPGMETFPGQMFHSIFYRKPEPFAGKTVVIMGAGVSGIDIGLQISWFAKKVYLSHRNDKIESELPENMEQIVTVVSINGKNLTLSDGRIIIADAFIFCTGYDYDYPFLGDDSGIEVVDGKYVRPLYKNLISVRHPTMAFPGLLFPSIPFAMAYVQARYYVSLLQGKIVLPSCDEMLHDSQLEPGVPTRRAHFLFKKSIAYYDELARLAAVDTIGDKMFARIFWYFVENRKNDLLHFKDKDVVVYEDGHVEMPRRYYPIFGFNATEKDIIIY